MNTDRLSSDQAAYLAALRDSHLGILAARRAVRRPLATYKALRRRHLVTFDGANIVLTQRGRMAIAHAVPVAAGVAPVALVGRPFYDEVAWRAECRVPRCGWLSDPVAGPHGVEEAPAELRELAAAHGDRHNRAAAARPGEAARIRTELELRDAELAAHDDTEEAGR